MKTKKYSSYAEIERDLEILIIERELHYQKICLSVQHTGESIIPFKTISFIRTIYKNVFTGKIGTIIKILLPIAVGWFKNKKRGD